MWVSARTGAGLSDLLGSLERELPRPGVEVEVLVPFTHGGLVARVHRDGEILAEGHTAAGTRLHARVDAGLAAELAAYQVGPATS